MEEKNIVCCCDRNYLQHVGVLLCSLYEHNKDLDKVHIHLITFQVPRGEVMNLHAQIESYGWLFSYYQIDDIKQRLGVDIPPTISIASYIRLFLTAIIPEFVSTILYLDCDIIINGSLKKLFELDLTAYYIAGALDIATKRSCAMIDINNDPYFNAGMLLINLNLWRKNQLQAKFIDYLKSCNGHVFHHDQGLINKLCKGYKLVLGPQWNVLTAYYDFPYENLRKHCDLFYAKAEIDQAKESPIIIHFTPSMSNRPWMENCSHPFKHLYGEFKRNTSWKDVPLQKDNRKLRLRILAFIYHHFPISLYEIILKIRGLFSDKI